MRTFIFAAVLALLSSAASAQNCNVIGTQTFCDNGISSNRVGN